MEQWIRDLINSVTSGLTNLINAAVDRILWVYNVFIAFCVKVRTAFDGALVGIRAKLAALLNLANEIYWTAWWIINVRIPQAVATAVNDAVNFLLHELRDARDFLRGVIDSVIDWTVRQVSRIDAFISRVITWISDKINIIVDTLTRVRDIVMALLTDPRHLAAWAIDAIVGEFLRWLDRNADRIAMIIRDRSVQFTMQAATRIEDIIVRLL